MVVATIAVIVCVFHLLLCLILVSYLLLAWSVVTEDGWFGALWLDRWRRGKQALAPEVLWWRARVLKVARLWDRNRYRHTAMHTSPLVTAAPILLHSYLAPSECLALWRTNRALAQLVWQHAPNVSLALSSNSQGSWLSRPSRDDQGHHKATKATTHRASWLSRRMASKALTLQAQIAKNAPPTFVALCSTNLRITTLHFTDMRVSLDELQVINLPHLRKLVLQGCELSGKAFWHRSTFTLHSLSCTNCQLSPEPKDSPTQAWWPFTTLTATLPLCRKPWLLQHLTTDDTQVDLYDKHGGLRQFPALEQLSITQGTVKGADFEYLLSLPALLKVAVHTLDLTHDHTARPCSWQELRVLEGTGVRSLAALPLAGIRTATGSISPADNVSPAGGISPIASSTTAGGISPAAADGIQRCVVQQYLSFGHPVNIAMYPGYVPVQGLQALCRLTSLVFEPAIITRRGDREQGIYAMHIHGLHAREPGFEVYLGYCDTDAPLLEVMMRLVAKHLVGGTLVLTGCRLRNPGLLQALRHVPPTVIAVSFPECWFRYVPRNPRDLFAYLPQHVDRLVVRDINGNFTYHRGGNRYNDFRNTVRNLWSYQYWFKPLLWKSEV